MILRKVKLSQQLEENQNNHNNNDTNTFFNDENAWYAWKQVMLILLNYGMGGNEAEKQGWGQ